MISTPDEAETNPETIRAYKLVTGQNLIGVQSPQKYLPGSEIVMNPGVVTIIDPMTYDISRIGDKKMIVLTAFTPGQQKGDSFTFLQEHIMGEIGRIPLDVTQAFYRNSGRKYLHIATEMPPEPGG